MSRTKFFWYIYGGNSYTDFNFEWCPPPWEESHIHVFPSQWQGNGDVYFANRYTVGERQWHWRTEHSVIRKSNFENWTVPEEIDHASIDFSWHPNTIDPPYIYHFPSEWQQSSGLTYTVPGATEIKLMDEAPMLGQRMTRVLDIFFIDRGNHQAEVRYERLCQTYPEMQRVRYANSMIDTVKRCANRSRTSKFWVISSLNVYTDFDFSWQPESWQRHMTHVFGSQWNKWSDTFLISKWEVDRNAKWAHGIEEFPNLNFVQDQKAHASDDANNIYYVEWGNTESIAQFENLKAKYPNIKTTRFVDNYLDTFKRVMSTATTEHVWIINSVCDYSKFDFSWQPEAWQADMIHVFPSGFERRGDTFYINVEMFKKQMVDLELLDWFNVINYCDEQKVNRWPAPHHYYTGDDLVTEVKNYQFEFPYAVFSTYPEIQTAPEMCLWSKKDRIAERYTASGCVSVIPRDIKSEIRTQIYDYPYVNTQNLDYMSEESLDIVYISNGEPDADKWYSHLRHVLNKETSGFPTLIHDNRIVRVSNVNGRAEAYRAAAEASRTPWFFAVFAKLEVNSDFDWAWQPDYWQEPKHYIFHALNPVNGLEYGHQAMIAYNKRLVLETTDSGLDFTLSKAHEVVPVLSGTAHFNQDSWMTWRTAFREVLKLKQFEETSNTMEGRYRLKTWLTKAEGNHADWCLRGAADAVEYYESVNGDPRELQRSFEWAWLRDYFTERYKI